MMELKIDKNNWSKVKLGDVVVKQEENDKAQAHTRFNRFLKVEHLDAESLHIKRWGTIGDEELPPTFYKIFRTGQILFPTRNPHLKRTALASFEGICGEKTLTLEPKQELVTADFLAFLFHSEAFYEHTTSSIIGSTNPHVRWRDVANYEFLLPPKAEQARLAELLWAMDEVIQKEKAVLGKLEKGLDTSIENQIHGIEINGKTIREVIEEIAYTKEVVHLPNLGEILKGKGIAKSEVIDEGFPCIRYGELYTKHHRIVRKYHSFVDRISADNSFKLQKNDILFASSGETITEIGKSAAFIDDIEAYAGSDTLIFRPFDMNGIFLGYLMNSQLIRQQLNKFGTGATVMHIYPSDLKMVKLPNIKREDQDKIANNLEQFSSNIDLLKAKIAASQALQKSLINQLF